MLEQVRSINGQPLQPTQPPTYPYIAIIKDRLYRLTQDSQSKEDDITIGHIKEPSGKCFSSRLIQIRWPGHLGQTATLNRL
ncbi:MAG: hypothetical protein ACRC9V_01830, partial [Aeromonas sp.]